MGEPRRPIALAGFMGAGKTTTGRLLAERLGLPFHDSDEHVETKTGRRVADFFAAGQEAEFRRLEAAAVAELVGMGSVVIALGGGALLDPASRDLLLERAVLVHLELSWSELEPRLPALEAARPLLQGRAPAAVRDLFERRRASYEVAHISVHVAGKTPDQVADEVLRSLPQG